MLVDYKKIRAVDVLLTPKTLSKGHKWTRLSTNKLLFVFVCDVCLDYSRITFKMLANKEHPCCNSCGAAMTLTRVWQSNEEI